MPNTSRSSPPGAEARRDAVRTAPGPGNGPPRSVPFRSKENEMLLTVKRPALPGGGWGYLEEEAGDECELLPPLGPPRAPETRGRRQKTIFTRRMTSSCNENIVRASGRSGRTTTITRPTRELL